MKKPLCIFIVSATVLNFAACNLTNDPDCGDKNFVMDLLGEENLG